MAIVKKNIGKDQKTYFSIIEKKGFKRTKNEKIATTTIRLFFPTSWIDKSASGTEYIHFDSTKLNDFVFTMKDNKEEKQDA